MMNSVSREDLPMTIRLSTPSPDPLPPTALTALVEGRARGPRASSALTPTLLPPRMPARREEVRVLGAWGWPTFLLGRRAWWLPGRLMRGGPLAIVPIVRERMVEDGGENPLHRETVAVGAGPKRMAGSSPGHDGGKGWGKEPMHRETAAGDAALERMAGSAPGHDAEREAGKKPMHRGTGPLRNGNPRGNPNLAPRCGARTRAGCPCKAPALRGRLRCRMHGGASTGPRTEAGMARLRAARTRHGFYSAASLARRRHTRALLERGRVLAGAVAVRPWLPEALQARLMSGAPEFLPPPDPAFAGKTLCTVRTASQLAEWKVAIAAARVARREGKSPCPVSGLSLDGAGSRTARQQPIPQQVRAA
jgi:hypothetical protein